MPFALEQMTQGLAILDKIDPVSQGAGTVNGSGVDMSKVQRLLAVLQTGVLGASATVDAKLQSCPVQGFGANVHDISGAAIVQLTQAGGKSNKVVTIEVRADQVAQQNAGDRYVRLVVTVAVAASLIAAVVYGGEAEFKPGKSQNIAAVDQSVVVP